MIHLSSFYSNISSENIDYTIEYLFFSKLRQDFIVEDSVKDRIIEITCTENLYKVFERC